MTLGCCFLSDSRNIFVQARVISVRSWYLTSLINLTFFELTLHSFLFCTLPLFGSWCFVSLFDVSFFELFWSFRFHSTSWNFLFLQLRLYSFTTSSIRKGKRPWSFSFWSFCCMCSAFFLCMIHVHHMKDTGFHIICVWSFRLFWPFENHLDGCSSL